MSGEESLSYAKAVDIWIESTDQFFSEATPLYAQSVLDGLGLALTGIHNLIEVIRADVTWRKT
jgi:hypothetical protein